MKPLRLRSLCASASLIALSVASLVVFGGLGANAVAPTKLAHAQAIDDHAEIVFPHNSQGWLSGVPGGWKGPIKVQFSNSAVGLYRAEVTCPFGLYGEAVWAVPEGGLIRSLATDPLPANDQCYVSVGRVLSPESTIDEWVLTATLVTGGNRLTVQDLDADSSFYPYPDGYKDVWVLGMELSQDAAVTATFKNSRGTVVARRSSRIEQGWDEVSWNGKSSTGRPVSAGLYTVSVTAQNIDGQTATSRTKVRVASNLVVAPGRVGKVRAGMTKKRALKTGLLRSNVKHRVPGVCKKTYPLLPKAPHERDYQPFLEEGKIKEVTVYNLRAARLPKGLTHKSTAARIRKAYRGRAKPGKALYGNNTLFVKSGRKHIAYIFKSQGRQLRSKDRLLLVAVSQGSKPVGLADDGC